MEYNPLPLRLLSDRNSPDISRPLDVLSGKSGVIAGDDVLSLFKYAKANKFAIPAIVTDRIKNVTSSSTAGRSPIIIQTSEGGGTYFAGKGVPNSDQTASISGAIAAVHYTRAIAPACQIPLDEMLSVDEASHMIDPSEEEGKDFNIATTKKYLALYTQPEDTWEVYSALVLVSPYFSIAVGFGNVHGVCKPGNMRLHQEPLRRHQEFTKWKISGEDEKPLFLVFHSGSGSTRAEFETAIGHGVVKVNLDTDLQYAYLTGIRDFVLTKKDYTTQ
ncbi:hypothetical protein HOY80DRAFT_1014393 [Tuber brumale]|nr:hypothetical protein HOY80DRAFT_1014393 [Tuber brumale]